MAKLIRQTWFWYAIAALIMLLDQLSKKWISANFEYNESMVFTSFFNFTLVHNHGAAFSFLSDAGGWQRWFFTAVAAIASLVIAIWIARTASKKPHEAFALAFILGGALGNLYDRVLLGYVVDFIVVHYEDNYFPAFNLADSAITLGAIVLIVDMLFNKENKTSA